MTGERPLLRVSLLTVSTALVTWNAAGQIIVPDRLQGGARMDVLVTPADQGVLAFDSVRTLPAEAGGRDTWWHRHALFSDGAIQLAMDPVVDYARDWRRSSTAAADAEPKSGFRNIRGVRYSGSIDGTLGFGGKVLEMQRTLVGPETEWVLAAQGYPGMGPGKLRPAGDGLFGIDHSLAEVWFDLHATDRLHLQWGLGAVGMGPGTRNLLWNADMAPAPYLLMDVDLGKGWHYRWLHSRQRSTERLPADGGREGRYAPLGLGVRSLGKSFSMGESQLNVNWIVAQWTNVFHRGNDRSALADWGLSLAPWSLPAAGDTTGPHVLAGHHGLDVQWRRPRSTWYGQVRFSPWLDERYDDLPTAYPMIGHVRHGERWTVWTEYAPTSALAPSSLDPASSGGSLGTRSLSSLQPDWVQGLEWRPGGVTVAAEVGRLSEGISWKTTVSIPSITADVGAQTVRATRKTRWPNRWLPALVPLSPFVSIMGVSSTGDLWWSAGISSPVMNSRKTH